MTCSLHGKYICIWRLSSETPSYRQWNLILRIQMIFWAKLHSSPKLPGYTNLCMVDVVGLDPNILREEGLSALRKQLDNQMEKYITSDMLFDLAEVVLKKIFLKKSIKAKKRDCNWVELCTFLLVFCLRQNRRKNLNHRI